MGIDATCLLSGDDGNMEMVWPLWITQGSRWGHRARSLSSLFNSRIPRLGNQPLANGTDAIASCNHLRHYILFYDIFTIDHQHIYIYAYI